VVAWLGASPAHAQPVHAEDLIRQGVELRRAARDADALALFRRAYTLDPTARGRAQMGLAEEALSDWLNAEQDIAAAAGDDDPWIARNADALGAALRDVESHLASLRIRANVDGAQIWVDGTVRAKLPIAAPLRVIAGSLDVRVIADGFEPVEQVVVLPAGGELRQTLILRPIASALPEPVPMPSASPVPSAAPLPTPGRSESRSTTTLGWVLLGSAGALVLGSATANVVGSANASVYNDDARCLYGDLSRDQRCGSYRDRAEAASALAVVGYALGAAAGIASGMIFVLASKRPSVRRTRRFFRVRSWARGWVAGGGSDWRLRAARSLHPMAKRLVPIDRDASDQRGASLVGVPALNDGRQDRMTGTRVGDPRSPRGGPSQLR